MKTTEIMELIRDSIKDYDLLPQEEYDSEALKTVYYRLNLENVGGWITDDLDEARYLTISFKGSYPISLMKMNIRLYSFRYATEVDVANGEGTPLSEIISSLSQFEEFVNHIVKTVGLLDHSG